MSSDIAQTTAASGDHHWTGPPPALLTLVLLAAVSPLAINLFVPSMPSIAAELDAPYATVQLGLSLYLIMTAALQLLIGPLSDLFGRKPVVLAGMALFLAGTAMCVFAQSVEMFLGGRIVQAASASGMVLSRAIVRDVYPREKAASAMGYMVMGMAIAPMVGPAIGDAVTGFYAAYGILAALYEREKTGKGRKVETSMFEALCHFNLDDFTHYLSVDQVMGPWSRPHVSQSYVFECEDGGWIALHMSSPPKFWENLATAVGEPDMLKRPEFESRDARIANYEAVVAFLAPIFARHPRSWWEERLVSCEVPHSPVYSSKEVLDGELAKHHRMEIATEGPRGRFRTIRFPVRFDGETEESVTAPPELGADNAAILGRKG